MAYEEKRRFPRHPFIAEVRFRSDSPPVMARIADISEGGIFIDTVVPLSEGSMVTVSFYLPDGHPDTPFEGSGKVAWTQTTVGVGIEFDNLDEGNRERLKKFLAGI